MSFEIVSRNSFKNLFQERAVKKMKGNFFLRRDSIRACALVKQITSTSWKGGQEKISRSERKERDKEKNNARVEMKNNKRRKK